MLGLFMYIYLKLLARTCEGCLGVSVALSTRLLLSGWKKF